MKIVFAALVFFNFIGIYGQGWLDVGLKGGVGPTLLMNQNIFGDAGYNHQLGASGCFGGKIGLNFNSNHQITVDVMVNNFNQKFKYSEVIDTTSKEEQTYESNIKYRSLDFILMYRHNSDGRYFEVGPLVSNMMSVERGDSKIVGGKDLDFTSDMVNKIQAGFVFGFGAYFIGNENFGITSGLRISYIATDLISTNGINKNYPNLIKYDAYKASHPLFIQIVFEANLDFAYLSKAKCGKRKLLMF